MLNLQAIKDGFFLILALFILTFFLYKGCGPKPIINNSDTVTVTIHKTDTIRDTVTVYKFKPKKVPVHDSILVPFHDSTICQYQRTYSDTSRDSNIVIINNIAVQGKLNKLQTSYKLLVPLKIVDSVFTTTTITNTIDKTPKFSMYGGISAVNIVQPSLQPYLTANLKKFNAFYGYNLNTQEHTVGVGIKLFAF